MIAHSRPWGRCNGRDRTLPLGVRFIAASKLRQVASAARMEWTRPRPRRYAARVRPTQRVMVRGRRWRPT